MGAVGEAGGCELLAVAAFLDEGFFEGGELLVQDTEPDGRVVDQGGGLEPGELAVVAGEMEASSAAAGSSELRDIDEDTVNKDDEDEENHEDHN